MQLSCYWSTVRIFPESVRLDPDICNCFVCRHPDPGRRLEQTLASHPVLRSCAPRNRASDDVRRVLDQCVSLEEHTIFPSLSFSFEQNDTQVFLAHKQFATWCRWFTRQSDSQTVATISHFIPLRSVIRVTQRYLTQLSDRSSRMAEDEGSAILATSILASFRPLSSLKRLAKLFSSGTLKKRGSHYGGSSVVVIGNDSHIKDDEHLKASIQNQNGSSCCQGNLWKSSFQIPKSLPADSSLPKSSDGLERHVVPELVKFKDVPAYLQFNQYVLRGYRPPNLTMRQCFTSLFYFHNETINIMTHGTCLADR